MVTIKLDRVRTMRFDYRAMKRFSALTGKSITAVDPRDMLPPEMEKLAFCMLQEDAEENGEKLKLTDMEELLQQAPVGVLFEAIGETLSEAFGKAKDEDGQPEEPAEKNG